MRHTMLPLLEMTENLVVVDAAFASGTDKAQPHVLQLVDDCRQETCVIRYLTVT